MYDLSTEQYSTVQRSIVQLSTTTIWEKGMGRRRRMWMWMYEECGQGRALP